MVRAIVVGYIVKHGCLRFVRGVVRAIVVGYIVNHCRLMFLRGVVRVISVGYIVNHCCSISYFQLVLIYIILIIRFS
jgi:uncharacterized membrane protein